MNSTIKDILDYEKQNLLILGKSIEKSKDELIKRLNRLFISMAFDNRYTIHPRLFAEVSKDQVENLLYFFNSGDKEIVTKQGKRRATQGLGERNVMMMGSLFRLFCLENIDVQNNHNLLTIIKGIDVYMMAYMEGYINSREQYVLDEQERLRKAFDTVKEQERQESNG